MIILGFPIFALNNKHQQNSDRATLDDPAGIVEPHEDAPAGAPSGPEGGPESGSEGSTDAESDEKPR